MTASEHSTEQHGSLVSWNDEKGYGFVAPDGGGAKLFVHITAFPRSDQRPRIGDRIRYVIGEGRDGRPCATQAKWMHPTLAAGPVSRVLLIIGLFFLIVGSFILRGLLPFYLLGVYAVMSLITFIAYARDKSASRRQDHRTPEKKLHSLALAGGWPGALLAQQLLRHKSKKPSFRVMFWFTVLINVGGLYYLGTNQGKGLAQIPPRLASLYGAQLVNWLAPYFQR